MNKRKYDGLQPTDTKVCKIDDMDGVLLKKHTKLLWEKILHACHPEWYSDLLSMNVISEFMSCHECVCLLKKTTFSQSRTQVCLIEGHGGVRQQIGLQHIHIIPEVNRKTTVDSVDTTAGKHKCRQKKDKLTSINNVQ